MHIRSDSVRKTFSKLVKLKIKKSHEVKKCMKVSGLLKRSFVFVEVLNQSSNICMRSNFNAYGISKRNKKEPKFICIVVCMLI